MQTACVTHWMARASSSTSCERISRIRAIVLRAGRHVRNALVDAWMESERLLQVREPTLWNVLWNTRTLSRIWNSASSMRDCSMLLLCIGMMTRAFGFKPMASVDGWCGAVGLSVVDVVFFDLVFVVVSKQTGVDYC